MRSSGMTSRRDQMAAITTYRRLLCQSCLPHMPPSEPACGIGKAIAAKYPPGAHVDCVGNSLDILELSKLPYALLVEILQLLHDGSSNDRRI